MPYRIVYNGRTLEIDDDCVLELRDDHAVIWRNVRPDTTAKPPPLPAPAPPLAQIAHEAPWPPISAHGGRPRHIVKGGGGNPTTKSEAIERVMCLLAELDKGAGVTQAKLSPLVYPRPPSLATRGKYMHALLAEMMEAGQIRVTKKQGNFAWYQRADRMPAQPKPTDADC